MLSLASDEAERLKKEEGDELPGKKEKNGLN